MAQTYPVVSVQTPKILLSRVIRSILFYLGFIVGNFVITQYGLHFVLGDSATLGLKWCWLAAFCLCCIDLALFIPLIPKKGGGSSVEPWGFYPIWLLLASFNAMIVWWSLSNAITLSNVTYVRAFPVIVTALLLLLRVLITASLSITITKLIESRRASVHYVRQKA